MKKGDDQSINNSPTDNFKPENNNPNPNPQQNQPQIGDVEEEEKKEHEIDSVPIIGKAQKIGNETNLEQDHSDALMTASMATKTTTGTVINMIHGDNPQVAFQKSLFASGVSDSGTVRYTSETQQLSSNYQQPEHWYNDNLGGDPNAKIISRNTYTVEEDMMVGTSTTPTITTQSVIENNISNINEPEEEKTIEIIDDTVWVYYGEENDENDNTGNDDNTKNTH